MQVPIMALAFSCRSSRQGFLLFQLVGVGLSPMHLPEQQGRGVLLSSQATTLETFSHRNHVIWYLECYRCQILPFLFFFFFFLSCRHAPTPYSWNHIKKWVGEFISVSQAPFSGLVLSHFTLCTGSQSSSLLTSYFIGSTLPYIPHVQYCFSSKIHWLPSLLLSKFSLGGAQWGLGAVLQLLVRVSWI